MKKRKAEAAAPVALAVALACALFAVGCDREKPGPAPYSPESYMKDKDFRAAVDAQAKKRDSLMGRHVRLSAELEKAKAAGDAAKAESLEKELEACKAEYEKSRAEMLRTVRERISPKGGKSGKPLKEGR